MKNRIVSLDNGAEAIMSVLEQCYPVIDIWGEKGTNAGGMLERVRIVMAQLTNQDPKNIKIQDLLAVNTFVPQKVKGGIAEEFSMENAIGLAAMVKADKLQMEMIAMELQNKINKKKAKIWLNNIHWVTEAREYFLSNRPLSGAKAIAQRGSNTESNNPMCWLLQPNAFRRGMKLLTTMPLGINTNNNKINQ